MDPIKNKEEMFDDVDDQESFGFAGVTDDIEIVVEDEGDDVDVDDVEIVDEAEAEDEVEDEGEAEEEAAPAPDNSAEIAAANQRAADAEARLAAERNSVIAEKKKTAQAHIAFAESEDKNMSSEIRQLRKQIEEAGEEGETDKKYELEEALDKVKDTQAQVRKAKSDIEAQVAKGFDDTPTAKAEAAPVFDHNKNPETSEWIKRNSWFMNAGDNKSEILKRHYALQLDDQMQREGKFNPSTRAYFDELDRKVKEKMGTQNTGGKKSGSKVAPVGGASKRPKSKDQVALNRTDFNTMRELGLNPNNSDHVKEFALNKRDTETDPMDGGRPGAKYPTLRNPVKK